MNPIFEMAKRYYPSLWGPERLARLQEAGQLTSEEVKELMGEEEDVDAG